MIVGGEHFGMHSKAGTSWTGMNYCSSKAPRTDCCLYFGWLRAAEKMATACLNFGRDDMACRVGQKPA